MSRSRVRKVHLLLPLLLSTLFLLTGATPASAHAEILNSFPTNGQRVMVAPTKIFISYSEKITTDSDHFRLINSSGSVIKSKFLLKGKDAYLLPTQNLTNGSYSLSYQVVSADGHIVAGVIPFTIGTEKNSSIENIPNLSSKNSKFTGTYLNDRLIECLIWILLLLLLASLFAGKYFIFRIISILEALIILESVTSKYLDLGSLAVKSGYVKYCLIYFIAILFANIALFTRNIKKIFIYYFLLVTAAFQALTQGHSHIISKYSTLSVIFLSLHLLGAFMWVSAVTSLIFGQSREILLRVSKAATVGLVIMLISGTIVSLTISFYRPGSLSRTWLLYLLIKIGFLIIALVIGAIHHLKIKRSKSLNRNSIIMEIGLFIAILSVTSLLISNSPDKAIDISAPKVQESTSYLVKLDNGGTAKMELNPIEKRANTYEMMVELKSPDGKISKINNTDVYFTSSDKVYVDLKYNLKGLANHYMGEVTFPVPGKWKVYLNIMLDEFTQVQGSMIINV